MDVGRADTESMARTRYTADPATLTRELRVDEIEEILEVDGKGFVKDREKVIHLLQRAHNTLVLNRKRVFAYEQRLEEAQRQLTAMAGAGGGIVDPEEALKYADPRVIAQMAGGRVAEMAEAAEKTRRAAEISLARAQRALTELAEREDLDPEVAKAILEVRDQMV